MSNYVKTRSTIRCTPLLSVGEFVAVSRNEVVCVHRPMEEMVAKGGKGESKDVRVGRRVREVCV